MLQCKPFSPIYILSANVLFLVLVNKKPSVLNVKLKEQIHKMYKEATCLLELLVTSV